jgi:hypothetical protein
MVRAPHAFGALLVFLTLGADRTHVGAADPAPARDVVAYTIRAKLLPEKKLVEGNMDLVWRNVSSAPIDHLYFHLYLNAFRDKDSTFLRESEGRHRGEAWEEEHAGRIEVRSMRTVDGRELWADGTRAFEAPDDGNEKDRTLARVALPAPVAPGDTVQLAVEFESHLPRVSARTGWAGDPERPLSLFFMVAQWFPKVAALGTGRDGGPRFHAHQFHAQSEFFADYGTYEVAITAPSRFAVGATGRLVERTDHPDGTTTHVYRQAEVHDFAWCASPHFHDATWRFEFDRFCREEPTGPRVLAEVERVAALRGVEPAALVQPPVSVRFLLQRDHVRLLPRFRAAVGAALALYGAWFGPYPYGLLTVVDPPDGGGGAGGMEYPTLVTVWGSRLAPAHDLGMEAVTVHEYAHQYFYGLLGSNEFEEAWLDEGLTSFAESRCLETAYGPWLASTRYGLFRPPHLRLLEPPKVFGKLHALLRLSDWLDRLPRPWKEPEGLLPVPEEDGGFAYFRDLPFLHFPARVPVPPPLQERGGVLDTESHDAMVRPGWEFARADDYWTNSYDKPTVVLHCLRGLMGEQAFDRALLDYATRFRLRHPTTEDFLAAMTGGAAEADRPTVEGFLRAMTDTAARFDVAVLEASNRELSGEPARFEWTIRVQRRGTVLLPIEIWAESEGASGATLLETWRGPARETTRTIRVREGRRLAAVRLGPRWLRNLDGDVSNDARRADGEGDAKAAVALAARLALHAEETLRSYAGLAR